MRWGSNEEAADCFFLRHFLFLIFLATPASIARAKKGGCHRSLEPPMDLGECGVLVKAPGARVISPASWAAPMNACHSCAQAAPVAGNHRAALHSRAPKVRSSAALPIPQACSAAR